MKQAVRIITAILAISILHSGIAPLAASAVETPARASSTRPLPEEFRLDNGLRVLLLENAAYPAVACQMYYGAGSRLEQFGKTGVAHLVEHLLFHETEAFKDGEIESIVVRNGGQTNGYTNRDFAMFYEVLSPTKLELALKVEAERMAHASFDAADLEEEIRNVKQELARGDEDPEELLAREVRAAAFRQHPYQNPVSGWEEDIARLTLQDARDFYSRHYRPDNATLVIAGNVTADIALPLVRKYFDTIPCTPAPSAESIIAEIPIPAEIRVVLKRTHKNKLVQIAYHGPALSDRAAPAMSVLEEVLNAEHSGLIKDRLVNTGVCLSARARFEAGAHPGLFTITCEMPLSNQAETVIQAVDQMMAELKRNGLCEEARETAVNLAQYRFASELTSPYGAAFQLGYFDRLATWQLAWAWPERLSKVTATDLKQLAQSFLISEGRTIGILTGCQPASGSQGTNPGKTDGQANPARNDNSSKIGYYPGHPSLMSFADARTALGPAAASKDSPATSTPASSSSPGHDAAGSGATDHLNSQQTMQESSCVEPAGQDDFGTQPAAQENIFSQLPPVGWNIHERFLSNGLRLIVFEDHMAPVVQIEGAILAGDRPDSRLQTWSPLLLAEVYNQGTVSQEPNLVRIKQERLGMTPGAMLTFQGRADAIKFHTQCLSQYAGQQLKLLGETLTSPRMTQESLTAAGSRLVSHLQEQHGKPIAKIKQAMQRTLQDSLSPYYLPTTAEIAAALPSINADHLKASMSNIAIPQACALVVAGDISPDEAQRLAESALGGWTGRPRAKPNLKTARRCSRNIRQTTLPLKTNLQAYISFGQLFESISGPDELAMLLLTNSLVAEHPIISRIGRRLRNNPASSGSASQAVREHLLLPLGRSLIWSFTVRIPPGLGSSVLYGIKEDLNALHTTGISAAELSEARRYLLGVYPASQMGSLPKAARSVLSNIMISGDPVYVEELLKRIRAATPASLASWMQRTLTPDRFALVVAAKPSSLRLSGSAGVVSQTGGKADLKNFPLLKKQSQPEY